MYLLLFLGIPGPEDDKDWLTAANNILIGTSQVVAMARFATKGEFENFTDEEIPYSDISLAIRSVSDVLSEVQPCHWPSRTAILRCPRSGVAGLPGLMVPMTGCL